MQTLRMRKNARKLADVLAATFIRISKSNLFCILGCNDIVSFPGVLCVVTQHSKRCATIQQTAGRIVISFLFSSNLQLGLKTRTQDIAALFIWKKNSRLNERFSNLRCH